MGVAAVALVYDLTRRHFGRLGGFVAGLVLATTPITVAISRHNNPDALLVLCCVAALWFVVRAFDDGRTRWIVLGGVCVGLGFQTKMGAALMVVPGIAAAWLWVAPRGVRAALGPQAGAGGPGGGGGGGVFGGPSGPLRLVEASLVGQAGWLLGFALVGAVGIVVASGLRRSDARSGWVIAVGGAFGVCAVAFSAAEGICHPY